MKIHPQEVNQIDFRTYDAQGQHDFIKPIWLDLLTKSDHGYFTSWGWIETWLEKFCGKYHIYFVVGYIRNHPAIGFFVGQKFSFRYGFLPSRLAALNATGDPYSDQLYIEYNSILIDRLVLINIDELFRSINSLHWDEFLLPGVSASFVTFMNLLQVGEAHGCYIVSDEVANCHYVELQKIRDANMNFFSLLSANKRNQIRRSIKQYEVNGAVEIHEAESTNEALSMLESLASLHQSEWKKRGKPGAFANQQLFEFHRSLIRNRFAYHEIQLLHISNDTSTIGYLYNFNYQNNILFYQSGFNYLNNNNFRPGFVSHYMAIMYNAKLNKNIYDFLAGDSTYKSSLSTNSVPMYWMRLIRSKERFLLRNAVVNMKTKIHSVRLKLKAITMRRK